MRCVDSRLSHTLCKCQQRVYKYLETRVGPVTMLTASLYKMVVLKHHTMAAMSPSIDAESLPIHAHTFCVHWLRVSRSRLLQSHQGSSDADDCNVRRIKFCRGRPHTCCNARGFLTTRKLWTDARHGLHPREAP